MRNPKASRAFTLVELLVVVGIIAVLIALLIPSLQLARQASKTSLCLSNLRTFADAASVFEAQNKGGLKCDLLSLLPDRQQSYGLLAPKLTLCPAEVDYIPNIQNYVGAQGFSYSWNSWIVGINGVLAETTPGSSVSAAALFHPSSVRNGSEVALMGDTITVTSAGMSFSADGGLQDPFNSGANYWPGQPPALPSLCSPTFHGRHGGRGAVLWLDGHASTQYAVPPPSGSTVADVSNRPQPASMYTKYHVGYLVRSPADLSSISALYYFVSKKDAISSNNINAYLKIDYNSYPAHYTVNPSAW